MANGGISFEKKPTFLGQLGSGFGTGLGSGLQQLAQLKLGELQQRTQRGQTAQGLKALLPQATPETISALSLLETPILQQYIKSELARPGEEEFARQLGLGIPSSQPTEPLPGQEPTILPKAPRLTQPQAIEVSRQRQKEKQQKEKISEARNIEYAKKLDTALSEKQEATNRLRTLDEMRDLEKTGKLNNPLMVKSLSELGLESLLSPESQAYQALEKDFLKDLKSIFGGRITELEMRTFLRSIPSLMNTKEGREKIADNLRYFYKSKSLKADSLKEILEEDPNIDPLQLSLKADKKIQKKLDKLGEKLKENLPSSDGSKVNKLPAANSVPDGTFYTRGNEKFIARNGKWITEKVKG